jgi:hypothetical protein
MVEHFEVSHMQQPATWKMIKGIGADHYTLVA